MTAEDEVRRLCAAMWPGQSVTTDCWRQPVPAARRGRREAAPRTCVIRVGAAHHTYGREIARGDSEAAAWDAALAEMRHVLPARLAQIDLEIVAMGEERDRIVAALEVKP